MPNILEEATATFQEIIRLHELNKELLETLSVTMEWVRNYAEKHSIPFPNGSAYNSLINKVDMLIDEITTDMPVFLKHYKLADEKKQLPRTDEEGTEPTLLIYKESGP